MFVLAGAVVITLSVFVECYLGFSSRILLVSLRASLVSATRWPPLLCPAHGSSASCSSITECTGTQALHSQGTPTPNSYFFKARWFFSLPVLIFWISPVKSHWLPFTLQTTIDLSFLLWAVTFCMVLGGLDSVLYRILLGLWLLSQAPSPSELPLSLFIFPRNTGSGAQRLRS